MFVVPNWLPIIEEGAAISRPLLEEAAAAAAKLGREAFKQGAQDAGTIAKGTLTKDSAGAAGKVLGKLTETVTGATKSALHSGETVSSSGLSPTLTRQGGQGGPVNFATRGGPVDFGSGGSKFGQGGPVEFRDRQSVISRQETIEQIKAPIPVIDGLPAWTPEGYLPPGVYRANLEDFTARFAFNDHRRAQLLRAEPMLNRLKAQGFESIYSTGSFTSTKPNPTDLDMLIHTGNMSESAGYVLSDLRGIPHGQTVMNAKRLYGVDLWQGKTVDGAACDHFKFFSLNRQDQPVGIVQLMLQGK